MGGPALDERPGFLDQSRMVPWQAERFVQKRITAFPDPSSQQSLPPPKAEQSAVDSQGR
jgi:hypothetical protein